jgi:hypothetical protein
MYFDQGPVSSVKWRVSLGISASSSLGRAVSVSLVVDCSATLVSGGRHPALKRQIMLGRINRE